MKKILLIVDIYGWALHAFAVQLQKDLCSIYDIEISAAVDESFLRDFLKNQKQYDVIHFLAAQAYFKCAKYTTQPCVFTLHHVHNGWKLFDETIHFADVCCVTSLQWKSQLTKRYGFNREQLFRIYFGIDTEIYSKKYMDIDENRNNSDIIIGFSVVNTPRKRVDRLWDCLQKLENETDIPFIVKITGNFWKNSDIPVLFKDRVKLLGKLPDSEMPGFYRNLDYYLCTSESEGGPLPVMESMSSCVTVITTDVGIVSELIVDGKTGFILNDGCIEDDFVKAIKETWCVPERRKKIGENARVILSKYFDSRNTTAASRYPDIYETAMRNYRSRSFYYKIKKHISAFRGNVSNIFQQYKGH